MNGPIVSTANTGNSITKYHIKSECPCLVGSKHREIEYGEIQRRNLDLCGQCERLFTDDDAADPRVTLIQCTNSKRDSKARARDLYDESSYFRKMRAWALARGNPWYILSAKHGLVAPDDHVDPYDERGLSESQAEAIAETLADRGVRTVDVTAGRDYTDHLVPALERRGIDVLNHFAGQGIGERQQSLQSATDHIRHNTL